MSALGDTIVVWKLDRLGRNTVKLIELVQELANRKINLKSLSEPVETTTATGNLFKTSPPHSTAAKTPQWAWHHIESFLPLYYCQNPDGCTKILIRNSSRINYIKDKPEGIDRLLGFHHQLGKSQGCG